VRLPVRTLLAALLLLGAACSGDDGGSRGTASTTSTSTTAAGRGGAAVAAGGPQACDLLAPGDLQAALHRDFGAGSPATAPAYGTGCTWGTSSGEPVLYVSIVVATDEQLQVALGRVASALYEQTRDESRVDENLARGDASYRAGPQVVVLDHGVLLSVAVTDSSPASLQGVVALARAATGALAR
jgi:hypothetical protein